jgi:hypothetical protein
MSASLMTSNESGPAGARQPSSSWRTGASAAWMRFITACRITKLIRDRP